MPHPNNLLLATEEANKKSPFLIGIRIKSPFLMATDRCDTKTETCKWDIFRAMSAKGKANILKMMDRCMMGNSLMELPADLVSTKAQMDIFMRENGKTISPMARARLLIKITQFTKET